MSRDLKRMRRKLMKDAARELRREAMARGGNKRTLREWVSGVKLSIWEAYYGTEVRRTAPHSGEAE